MYRKFEAGLAAAELAICADHDAGSFKPLPAHVDEPAAFLFDVGKVFDPQPDDDRLRRVRPALTPYKDLSRCWRSSWKALYGRNQVLAGWTYHVARTSYWAWSKRNPSGSFIV